MILTFEQRHSLGGRACPHFGGDSSSASTTQSTTNNTDKRQVLDGGAVGVSNDGGGTISLALTDQGAVRGGLDTANRALASNATNFEHLLSAADALYSKTQSSLDANVKLAGTLAGTAQTAYADAANQASGNKSLIMVAIVVVGVVAALAFGKH